MKPRVYLSMIFALACFSLLAQPKIISITYNGNEAILTRNTPPSGIIYYWQGTSCGSLMTNSATTYVASTSSTFYLREYNSSSALWATTCASTIVLMPDMTPPVLSNVTPGPISAGADIMATSNEDGMIYLVPAGTAANLAAITSAQVAQATSAATVPTTLATTGLPEGDYVVYAVDESDNISAASATITVSWATYINLSSATSDMVQLYPANVKDILHIKSDIRVSSAIVYSLQGARMIQINTPTDQIDMSSLKSGVYIVSLKLQDNTVFNGKITKR
jgi:hypothetical protein